jgi:hypothetical protein
MCSAGWPWTWPTWGNLGWRDRKTWSRRPRSWGTLCGSVPNVTGRETRPKG